MWGAVRSHTLGSKARCLFPFALLTALLADGESNFFLGEEVLNERDGRRGELVEGAELGVWGRACDAAADGSGVWRDSFWERERKEVV